jgi:transposase
MPRRYGYAPKGERCFGTHNWHSKARTNVIGALIGSCLLTLCLFNGSINSDIFYTWIKEDLLPKAPKNSVLVMDNAAFHKRADIQFLIAQSAFILHYLPAYSPDLNPIEHKWAQAKARRKSLFCSISSLFKDNYL